MSFSRNEKWTTSWINDMVSSPKFAKDLTSIYADDIIQAVDEDKAFPTISAAIEDMKGRTGISESQAIELRKVAAYKTDPKLYNSIENLEKLDALKTAKLLDAYASKCIDCTKNGSECSHMLSATTKRAMLEFGIDKLSARVDAFVKQATKEENKKKWAAFMKKAGANCSECGVSMMDASKTKCAKCEKAASAQATPVVAPPAGLPSAAASTKKAWFKGSDESVDRVIENNPEKLGYPKDIQYPRPPMAVPVGEDSRNWEQAWFEGAAAKTKQVMGPSGAELKEKQKWHRTDETPGVSPERIAAWKGFMSKNAKMNEGFKKYLEEQKAKKESEKPSEETSKKEESKEEKKSEASSKCSIKKAELVFPQQVYSALQQMTGSKEELISSLRAMVEAINADEYSGSEEREASNALSGITTIVGDDAAARWIVDTVTSEDALNRFQMALQSLNTHKASWKVSIRKIALNKNKDLIKAADVAPNDINELTEKAGDKLKDVATIIEDFSNSRQRLGLGEDQFVSEMATEYTNRLDQIIKDRSLASRIIDTIAKSAEKARSLLFIVQDLLQYEK